MTTARFCPSCGTLLPDVAQFCPKCGVDVQSLIPDAPTIPSTTPVYPVILPPSVGTHVVPPVETSDPTDEPPAGRLRPAERTNRQLYVIAAVVLLAAIIVGALLLGKMPMGGDRLERKNVNSDTIGEANAPSSPAPLGVNEQPPPPQAPPVTPATDLQTSPDILGTSVNTPLISTAPGSVPPPVATTPPMTTTPPLSRRPPRDAVPVNDDEISVSAADAISRVRATVRDARGLSDDCISVANQGYANAGYTLVVNDVCNDSSLGNWRVDAKTGEVFRQHPDGRYLKP